MAYKLILKDFETLEKNIFFLDSLPEEEALISDLNDLEVIKNLESFSKSNWYSKLSSGLILSDKINLNCAITLVNIENIPQSIKDEYYIFRVPIKIGISEQYPVSIEETFVSMNKNLTFYSSDEDITTSMDEVRIIHTGDIKNTEEYDLCCLLSHNIVADELKSLDISICYSEEE